MTVVPTELPTDVQGHQPEIYTMHLCSKYALCGHFKIDQRRFSIRLYALREIKDGRFGCWVHARGNGFDLRLYDT